MARYPNLTAGLDIRYFRDRSYLLLSANPYLSFALQENVSGYVQADINWQNSDDEKDAEQCEIELTNACLSLAKGGVSADLGLQTILVGNGLIMADDVPAITLDFSVGSSNLQMTLARVLDSSPMAVVTIGHQPGGFENLAVFGVWIRDEEDAFAKSLPQSTNCCSGTGTIIDSCWTNPPIRRRGSPWPCEQDSNTVESSDGGSAFRIQITMRICRNRFEF